MPLNFGRQIQTIPGIQGVTPGGQAQVQINPNRRVSRMHFSGDGHCLCRARFDAPRRRRRNRPADFQRHGSSRRHHRRFRQFRDRGGDQAVLRGVKELEGRGHAFESGGRVDRAAHAPAVAGLHASLRSARLQGDRPQTSVRRHRTPMQPSVFAVHSKAVHTAAEGNGPVSALDAALRKALSGAYPEVNRIRLEDYKVRILDGVVGTSATVRVLIENGFGEERWTTVGASSDVIEASWLALVDGIEYGLAIARDGANRMRVPRATRT